MPPIPANRPAMRNRGVPPRKELPNGTQSWMEFACSTPVTWEFVRIGQPASSRSTYGTVDSDGLSAGRISRGTIYEPPRV